MIETNILFQKHLASNRSKMDLKNLKICVDAGWSSRGHYANECAFIIIDKETGLLFDLIVVTRDKFSGPSGNMEAEAARIFCEKHKNTIELKAVVKDDLEDLKSGIRKEFDEYLQVLDDNLKKTEKKIIQGLFADEEKQYWEDVCNALQEKINYFSKIRILFVPTPDQYFTQYEIENESKYNLTPQFIELKNLIFKIVNKAEMYVTAYSTNKCESFMNSRTKFIDKRIDSSKQWEMRCQFSVLNRELPEWRTILMDQIGFTINLPQMVSQFQKNREKEYEKERQTKPEYIKYRYQQKNKKFHRRDGEIANGGYKFKDANVNKTIYKKKFRCRSCSSRYSIELSRILHEIIFHQRYPVPVEKDVIVQNLKQTKTQITRCERTLKKSIETLINRIKKKTTVRDKETLSVKNSALENLTNYQKTFYETYQLKKRTRKKKKNDQDEIEIFKEIDEEDEFDQRNSEEEGTGEELTENGFSEINKILTASDLKPSSGPKYDEMFGISFDKRLPSSFNNNNLLFEIDRNKNK
ncbi:hypothetical protein M0812_29653 [Anaeramoeba flamelloides]|uniref:C2H2-type domain-containing protein n=1 Tax=Anaeramoeba flamelloides TaxID=1746091 RepID=A0AAV7Y2B8_9EUKA|nr:hypothetical protein M0812_29653 [Anaeramoeba flamelloides]